MRSVSDDVAAVGRIEVVPTILEVMATMTGMRFTAVARVTDTSWTACAVRDGIAFGLKPGDELELVSTICNEIRQHHEPVVFGSASADAHWRTHHTPKQYGFESYVSIPIIRADKSFFGTLCAIDPAPAKLDSPLLLQTLQLLARLVASELDAQELSASRAVALAAATDAAERLTVENHRIAMLLTERERAEQAASRELSDTRMLGDVASKLVDSEGNTSLLEQILDTALQIADADAGTIQLLDSDEETLSLAVTRGFSAEMVAHFAVVDASSTSPCGVALATGTRASVVFDNPAAPDPDGSARLHLEAGLRSAQSTPLISRSGRQLGMFSTHWRERRELSERELRLFDLLGRQAADLIERNQVLEALQASDRRLREEARRKDEFIAILAHELRNPLAPIRSGVELLARVKQEPLVEQVRPIMARQVGHMARLIDDLLDVSRISSGKMQLKREVVTLDLLVESAVEANRAAVDAAGIELRVELDAPGRRLDVDPTRLSQVIANVLHNAVKFTQAGGRITIQAERGVARDGMQMEQVIRVTDTGLGIPADQLSSIFELFTQVRPDSAVRHGGMGIGLALSRSLVELHGGTITAESAGQGLGSEFTIRIPVGTTGEDSPVEQVGDPASRPNGERVLLVDDNRDAADSLALLLTLHGTTTQVAYDANHIIEAVEAYGPSLVLLDLGLPGIDGYEACRRIRGAIGAAVRIIALTGWGQEDDRRRTVEAGFDAHLTKPVDFTRLLAVIENASA